MIIVCVKSFVFIRLIPSISNDAYPYIAIHVFFGNRYFGVSAGKVPTLIPRLYTAIHELSITTRPLGI